MANQNDELIKKNRNTEDTMQILANIRKREVNFKKIFFSASLTLSNSACSSPNKTRDILINCARINNIRHCYS
jgi:hypothetical protein